jgi:hypothetical protein
VTTLYLILTAVAGAVAAFFGGQHTGKRQGRLSERYRAAERDLEAGKQAKDNKAENADETDADLIDRLSDD